MDFYYLRYTSWQHSQSLYHAAAHLGREALIMLIPESPYICIGFHQDASQEIDLEAASAAGIPVFRREVGGGAVYLDRGQLFFQLILRKDNPKVPALKEDLYRIYLDPIIETYRSLGIPAEYKPVNDIIANGRKVSGTGAAEIGETVVLVGNYIIDFNYEMMSKVLRVPDEKFRDKVYKTLQENLSTILRETGKLPDLAELAEETAKRYEALLGPMKRHSKVDDALLVKAAELEKVMITEDWLFQNDRRRTDYREIKIRDGVFVIQNILKTPGGLVRASAVNENGKLRDVHFSGDFFFFPSDLMPNLEKQLDDVDLNAEKITNVISAYYQTHHIESPGLTPQDFGRVLVPPTA